MVQTSKADSSREVMLRKISTKCQASKISMDKLVGALVDKMRFDCCNSEFTEIIIDLTNGLFESMGVHKAASEGLRKEIASSFSNVSEISVGALEQVIPVVDAYIEQIVKIGIPASWEKIKDGEAYIADADMEVLIEERQNVKAQVQVMHRFQALFGNLCESLQLFDKERKSIVESRHMLCEAVLLSAQMAFKVLDLSSDFFDLWGHTCGVEETSISSWFAIRDLHLKIQEVAAIAEKIPDATTAFITDGPSSFVKRRSTVLFEEAFTTTIQAFFISTLPKDHEAFGLPVDPPPKNLTRPRPVTGRTPNAQMPCAPSQRFWDVPNSVLSSSSCSASISLSVVMSRS